MFDEAETNDKAGPNDPTDSSSPDTSAETENTDGKGKDEKNKDSKDSKESGKTVPYARFKEINDELKALKDAQKKAQEEADRQKEAALPEMDRLKKRAAKAEEFEALVKQSTTELEQLKSVLEGVLEAEMSALSEAEKKAIESMGDSVLEQLRALQTARKAGWIGKDAAPPERTHQGKTPASSSKEKPKSFADARKAFSEAAIDLRKRK